MEIKKLIIKIKQDFYLEIFCQKSDFQESILGILEIYYSLISLNWEWFGKKYENKISWVLYIMWIWNAKQNLKNSCKKMD